MLDHTLLDTVSPAPPGSDDGDPPSFRPPGDWRPAEAHRHPCRTVGDTLAVFEGPRRLIWARRGADQWRPVRLWPDEEESRALRTHLARGGRILVVVEELPCSVPLLPEEADAAPPALAPFLDEDRHGPVVAVPGLTWLPPDLRERGERFVAHSRSMLAANPKLLLSSFVTDPDGDAACAGVRFAVRTGSRRTQDSELVALAWN